MVKNKAKEEHELKTYKSLMKYLNFNKIGIYRVAQCILGKSRELLFRFSFLPPKLNKVSHTHTCKHNPYCFMTKDQNVDHLSCNLTL